MANKKITELNEASSITSADWLVMVDTGNDETKKIHPNLVGASIPVQDTAPENPEEDDLWIDTSEPEEMQEAIVNEYSESINETYSCDYINKINNYLTTEQVIGKWITGKPLYRKVIDLGALPNASAKTIPTGLTFNSTHCILTKLYGIASYSNGISFPLPFSSNNGVEYNVALNVDNSNNVAVATAQDRSGMTGYAVLEYIKATD